MCVSFSAIPREINGEADALVKGGVLRQQNL